MRHVFPTSEVPHLWAHQSQQDARNPTGNLFFQGPTIYSYRTSWPLARIYSHPKRGKLVLTNSDRVSNTTATHQSEVSRACSHLPRAAVPHVNIHPGEAKELHARNLEYFAKEIAEHLAKAKRAMQVSTVDWRTASAQSLHQNALDYSAFFGIRRKVAPFPAAELDAARERAQRIETPDPVRDAAKIRARERKAARERVALQADFERYCGMVREYNAIVLAARAAHDAVNTDKRTPEEVWRATGRWPHGRLELPEGVIVPGKYTLWPERRYKIRNNAWRKLQNLFDLPRRESTGDYLEHPIGGAVLLRVSGDQIESSMGARIPLEHAPRIWTLVQACRSSGRAYERNGHTEHAGPYAIDSVSAEGELRAGCHTIPYAELELLARALGLPC